MPKIYNNLHETIVQKAKDIIVSKGYSKLNMREVAKACGVALGTLYNYFPTKDALMNELMYRYWMDFIAAMQKIEISNDEFFLKLRKIYLLLESFLDTFKDTWLKLNKNQKGMTKEHYQQKQEVVDLFVASVERALVQYKNSCEFQKKHQMTNNLDGSAELQTNVNDTDLEINDHELATLIVQNFMLIAQMKQFEYHTFEKILQSYFFNF